MQLGSDSLIRAIELGVPVTFDRIKAEAELLDPEVWRVLQNYLAEKGLYKGAPDGIYGEVRRLRSMLTTRHRGSSSAVWPER